jgi:hypothetical protein
MHSIVRKAVISLLALSQTFGIAQAYPGQDPARSAYAGSATDNSLSGSNKEEALLTKRTVQISDLSTWGQGEDGLGTTWSGYLKEPKNSGWTTDTIDAYTKMAYDATQCGSDPPPVLVAALWVTGVGVYLGSVPHGTMLYSSMTAQVGFHSMLRGQAPLLYRRVKDRTAVETSIYHAEDMAMYMYEKREKPKGPSYPNSYMFAWGQYEKGGTVGRKEPCTRLTKPGGKGINPSCRTTVRDIGITVF